MKTFKLDPLTNILSFDIEDWFHPETFSGMFPAEMWDTLESRVKIGTEIILNFLSKKKLKATFFILGWIAEKHPQLVTEISKEGHEIASHGYSHSMITQMTAEEFRTDLRKSLNILNALSDTPVIGFRAPTFSVTKETMWAIPIMYQEGIRYDSSVFPIHHDRYGIPDAPRQAYIIHQSEQEEMIEYPMTTVKIGNLNLPCSGGGYFRLYPFALSLRLMKECQKKGQKIIFYAHPWEFDKNLPKIKLNFLSSIRHYKGIGQFLERLDIVTDMFPFTSFRETVSINKIS